MDKIIVREVEERDAAALLGLMRLLDSETDFMLLEAGERETTLGQQLLMIQRVHERPNQMILVAVSPDGELVGYVAGLGGRARRNRHKADVVIGVTQGYVGQGLGTRLLGQLEKWARAQELHKLELTVMAHNKAAIRLYEKMGFMDEGRQLDSLCVNGRFVDELSMGKVLSTGREGC